MGENKIRQGDTIKVEFDLLDEDENPIIPSEIHNYEVYIYTINATKVLQAVCKKNADANNGEIDIDVLDDGAGTIGIVIPSTLSKQLTGIVYAEVVTQVAEGEDEEMQLFNNGQTGIVICEMEPSANANGL